MPEGIILIIIAFAAIAIISAIHGHKKEKERRAMLAAWASASGLVFSEMKNSGFDNRFSLSCFRHGKRRYGYNLSHGERGGYQMIAGDYHYETESRDSKGNTSTHHYHFSFALFQPPFPLRQFALRKEGIFDKVTAVFGFDDIDFESAEFSKAFHVKCEDRRWAYDLVHPRAMELLLRHRELRVEADRGCIAVFTGKRWGIPQFEHYANTAIELLDGIPIHAREIG